MGQQNQNQTQQMQMQQQINAYQQMQFAQQQQQLFAQQAAQQQQAQQLDTSNIDVEASSLNPEIEEFNPMSGGNAAENAATVALSVQEQLFAQLQQINIQMTNVKHQTDSILTPTFVQLSQSLQVFQANPALLQNMQNRFQFLQTQQQYQVIAAQIQQNQMTYAQLEQSLKYTQEMYQKNKDPQHVVDPDFDENNLK